jgi:DNA polymerase-3 subunit gamma/tau
MLAGAVVRTVDGGTLLLSHESAPLAKRLNEQRNTDVVEEALKDALGIGLKVRYEVGSPSDAGSADAPAAAADVARDEEDSMLAEAGSDNAEIQRRDPEEAALELLQNELGARRIDGG